MNKSKIIEKKIATVKVKNHEYLVLSIREINPNLYSKEGRNLNWLGC